MSDTNFPTHVMGSSVVFDGREREYLVEGPLDTGSGEGSDTEALHDAARRLMDSQ
ncbi:hypothetical protein GWI34_29865 [Actinomadura sp. DSM 109109]|nr:hypothetical protein [Actinomadura lepetitiana]